MASTVRKQFRASRTALAAVHNTKRSLAASFARDTPPRSSDPELLMNPFHCWRHSRLAGLGKDWVLLLLLAFGLCSLRKGVFVQFTADVLVLGVSLCQAFALKLASLMLDGIPCLCSLHERSLAALLLDLVALKLLGQKQGFITRLLVAWRGLCLHNACFSLALFS